MTVEAQIVWRIHMRSASEAGRSRILEGVVRCLGGATTIEGLEPRPEQEDHVAVLRTPLFGAGAAENVLEVLTLAGAMRSGWNVGAPQLEDDGEWSIELTATADADGGGFTVPGVVFAWASAAGPGGSVVEQGDTGADGSDRRD